MALFLLWVLHFRATLLWIAQRVTITSFSVYDVLGLLVVLSSLIAGVFFFRKISWPRFSFIFSQEACIGLVTFLTFDLINTALWHYHIVSAACFLLGGYCLLGFYLPRNMWLRGWFLAVLVTFTLPFIEHIQTFLGFPVRLLTAKIVSALMHALGAASISDATVIITENQASVVDLPCSGVKSIYTGVLFLCTLYFFQQTTFSVRLIGISVLYILCLLFFNIWRVFSLVYISHVLHIPEIGDKIHVALGVGGFLASGLVAWFLTQTYLPSSPSSAAPLQDTVRVASKKRYRLIVLILVCFLAADSLLTLMRSSHATSPPTPSQDVNLVTQGIALRNIPLTPQEQLFFQNHEVMFSQKYEGTTDNGLAFTLLLVSSVSWRTHHNPEVCLQGMGYQIERSEIRQSEKIRVRQVTLKGNQGTVLYWFANGDTMLSDYSERVWAGLLHPKKPWTLVEIGLNNAVDTDTLEVTDLIQRIHTALP